MTPRPEIFRASNATAAQFLWRRVRCSQIQKIVRLRHEAGETVDWRAWAAILTSERLWLHAGVYRHEDWRRSQSWPAANAATALLYGRNAPFERREAVPETIWQAVEEGVATGIEAGHQALSASVIARRLGVSAAFRREHRLWMIGATDKSRTELRDESRELATERQRARRQADRDRKQAQRRAAGMSSRDDYLDAAALRREAIALAGMSERTFKRRSPAEREKLLEAARDARGNGPSVSDEQYINITVSTDTLRPRELNHKAAAETAATPLPPAAPDIVSINAIKESATVASFSKGRRMQPERPQTIIRGVPLRHFIQAENAAHVAATAFRLLVESGARGSAAHWRMVEIVNEREQWLFDRLQDMGAAETEIEAATSFMINRIAELNAAARARGVPLASLDHKLQAAA